MIRQRAAILINSKYTKNLSHLDYMVGHPQIQSKVHQAKKKADCSNRWRNYIKMAITDFSDWTRWAYVRINWTHCDSHFVLQIRRVDKRPYRSVASDDEATYYCQLQNNISRSIETQDYNTNNQQAYAYVWQHGRLRKQARLGAETLNLKTVTRLHMQGCHRKYEALLIFKVLESFVGQN
jgi:hypothetical protein